MIISVLAVFIDLFVDVFSVLLIIRIILSWVVPDMEGHWFGRFMLEITEPVLAPVRRLLPQTGGFDLAPLVTVVALYAIRAAVFALLFRGF